MSCHKYYGFVAGAPGVLPGKFKVYAQFVRNPVAANGLALTSFTTLHLYREQIKCENWEFASIVVNVGRIFGRL